MIKISLKALTLATLALLSAASAQDLPLKTGLEVMQAQANRPKPATQTATMTMQIMRGGTTLSRSMKTWNANGGDKQVLKFLSPADVKGSGFMSLRNADGSKQNYLWLPALGRVRRLSAGDNKNSFFGSDLSNEDVGAFEVNDYTYKLLGKEGGRYQVEATPKGDSGYDRIVYTINGETLLNEKAEYYQRSALYKTLVASDFISIGKYVIPRTLTVDTPSLKSRTVLKFSELKVDVPIAADVFTERNLMK